MSCYEIKHFCDLHKLKVAKTFGYLYCADPKQKEKHGKSFCILLFISIYFFLQVGRNNKGDRRVKSRLLLTPLLVLLPT